MTKPQFHQRYQRILRQFARQLGLPTGSYDVRSNLGGPAVLGEVILHGESIYMRVGGSTCTAETAEVLYRSCRGRHDYEGGPNRYMPLACLGTAEGIGRVRAARVEAVPR